MFKRLSISKHLSMHSRNLSLIVTAKSVSKNAKNTIPSMTKIVATIGPASEQLPDLTKVIDSGDITIIINIIVIIINYNNHRYEANAY